jgi:alpha-ketoglutarate-dependent taurine dioxygenase
VQFIDVALVDFFDNRDVYRLGQDIRVTLTSGPGFVVLRHLALGDGNRKLLALARALGTISHGGELPQHPLEDGFVYRVEARGTGITDDTGALLYSTTATFFPCHTDGSARHTPYALVLLYCAIPDPIGGDTLILDVSHIQRGLSPSELRALGDPVYPFAFGLAPILSETRERMMVRHNRQDMDALCAAARVTLSAQHREAVDTLDSLGAPDRVPWRFKLQAEECLILDNTRVLHGRTAFPQNSARLLKRLRLMA